MAGIFIVGSDSNGWSSWQSAARHLKPQKGTNDGQGNRVMISGSKDGQGNRVMILGATKGRQAGVGGSPHRRC